MGKASPTHFKRIRRRYPSDRGQNGRESVAIS